MYVRRKVYSYSEPEEEQLYSVTMTETEYELFSDFMDNLDYYLYSDESDVHSGRDIGTLIGGGAGLAAGAGAAYGANKYASGFGKKNGKIIEDLVRQQKEAPKAAAVERNKAIDAFEKEWKELEKAGYTQKELEKKFKGGLEKNKKRIGNKFDSSKKVKELEKKIANRQMWGKYAKEWKNLPKPMKLAYGAGAAATVGGLGAVVGRPLGGAVNRHHND